MHVYGDVLLHERCQGHNLDNGIMFALVEGLLLTGVASAPQGMVLCFVLGEAGLW